jgi:hypothetical protein
MSGCWVLQAPLLFEGRLWFGMQDSDEEWEAEEPKAPDDHGEDYGSPSNPSLGAVQKRLQFQQGQGSLETPTSSWPLYINLRSGRKASKLFVPRARRPNANKSIVPPTTPGTPPTSSQVALVPNPVPNPIPPYPAPAVVMASRSRIRYDFFKGRKTDPESWLKGFEVVSLSNRDDDPVLMCNPKGVHIIQDRLELFCLVKD